MPKFFLNSVIIHHPFNLERLQKSTVVCSFHVKILNLSLFDDINRDFKSLKF